MPWTDWPVPLRDRDAHTLAEFDAAHADKLKAVMASSMRCRVLENSPRCRCGARDRAVWRHRYSSPTTAPTYGESRLFLLDEAGHPRWWRRAADYFSETGQRWAIRTTTGQRCRPTALPVAGAASSAFEWFDLVRIDHFRGLAAAWTIPAASRRPSMANGVPRGAALLQAIADEMGELPLVAEDLGIITPM